MNHYGQAACNAATNRPDIWMQRLPYVNRNSRLLAQREESIYGIQALGDLVSETRRLKNSCLDSRRVCGAPLE